MQTKLKLKDSIYILKEDGSKYVVIFTATRKIKKFEVDPLVCDMIENLKLEKTELDLFNELAGRYNRKDISDCLKALETEGIVRRYDGSTTDQRFSKQLGFIDELTASWEETLDLQNKIKNSSIAVFGVGGIGTWMVNSLYQIGVGNIKITDPDKVSESNLNRQLFFDTNDIGKYKVEVIESKLADAKITPFLKTVREGEDLEEIVSGCNFLVNCADSPSVVETTRVIDKYACKHSIPYCVAGGYNLYLGMVGPIIVPGKTASFEDFIAYQKKMDPLKDLEKIKDISQTGNLGSIAGAIANIQAMEIFKYLIGKGKLNLNRFVEIDFMDLNIIWREFSKQSS